MPVSRTERAAVCSAVRRGNVERTGRTFATAAIVPMPSPPATTRVTFPARAWAAAALAIGTMIVLLVIQLTSIESQRRIVRDQDRKVGALLRETLPLLRTAQPLADAAAGALPELRRGLRAADPVKAATAVTKLSTALTGQDRMLRLIDASLAALDELAGRHILQNADASLRAVPTALDRLRRTVVLQRDLLRMQRSTFQLQSQSLAVSRESLAIQRESLRHIRSLDRKTGGTAGPTGG